MKFGFCAKPENAALLAKAGYDYFEANFTELCGLSEKGFAELKNTVESGPIRPEVFNCFCPAALRLTGPGQNLQALREYTKGGFERAAQLGAETVVVGSGGARSVPEGYDREEAVAEFGRALSVIGDEAGTYGITVVVEPLRGSECNLINMVAEGASLVRLVNHPFVKLLADFYHMRNEAESMESLRGAGKLLRHLHLANYNGGRAVPADPDEDDYAAFFPAALAAGSCERVSIEANVADIASQAAAALSVLRRFAG